MATISTLEKANGTATLSAGTDIANAEVIVIGGKTYTFQTSLTNVDGHVKIGASMDATLANLAAAINLGAGSGTAYAAATTLHPLVSAAVTENEEDDDDVITLTAKVPGVLGNLIAVTTDTDLTLSAAVLENGAGSVITAIQEVITSAQVNSEVLQALQQFIIAAPAGSAA